MASRPVFFPTTSGDLLVRTESLGFEWSPGLSITQKQKNIGKIHAAIKNKYNTLTPLEISTKSLQTLGVSLSAFNLQFTTKIHKKSYTVEAAFQSSKVFLNGGPFKNLIEAEPRDAKRDPRLKESGPLISFSFFGETWPLEPKTMFYDWLYINALNQNRNLALDLDSFNCFTDIEFNPEKSINCQAYAAALYVSLRRRNLLDKAISNKDFYVNLVSNTQPNNSYYIHQPQERLI